jgi:hypothetical protein
LLEIRLSRGAAVEHTLHSRARKLCIDGAERSRQLAEEAREASERSAELKMRARQIADRTTTVLWRSATRRADQG